MSAAPSGSDPGDPGDPGDPAPSAAAPGEAERRRRRAAVFGEVLPDTTTDERGDGWSDRPGGARSDGEDPADERLRREVPPHHG